jgi:hypothetical protein
LAGETLARTSSGDFAGIYELAFQLVKIPGRREQAISVFREVVLGNPRQPDPLLILGTVLEKAGDPEAGTFMDLARRVWKTLDHSTWCSQGGDPGSQSSSQTERRGYAL